MTGIVRGIAGLPDKFAHIPDWRRAKHSIYRRGFYYSVGEAAGAATVNLTQNRLIAVPWWFSERTPIDRLCVLTIATASAAPRLGLYADLDGFPGPLICDAGTVDGTTSTAKEAVVNCVVGPGLVWFAVASQGATCQFRGIANVGRTMIPCSDASAATSSLAGSIRRVGDDITGELPSFFVGNSDPAIVSDDRYPFFAIRAA